MPVGGCGGGGRQGPTRAPCHNRRMKKLFTITALALACATLPAFAQVQPPVAFKGLLEVGTTLVKSFPVGDGLTGWVVRHPSGEHMVAYTTPGGEYLLAGAVFDKDGNNLTQQHVAAHVPKKDYATYMPALRKATAIVTGRKTDTAPTLYVFIDVNCKYCQQTYKQLANAGSEGVQVRWLPVAILGPTSSTKMETILSVPDPAAALDKAETNFPEGVEPAAKVSGRTAAILEENLELMRNFDLRGTPGIVYVHGGKPVTVGGAPSQEEMARILQRVKQ